MTAPVRYLAHGFAAGRRREGQTLFLEQRPGEQPALVGAGVGEGRDQVVETRADQFDRTLQHQLAIRRRRASTAPSTALGRA